jgi:hypothetical protein
MATALSAFTPYVAPDVPGCPEPMIDDAVRTAAIEFCEKTRALRERVAFNTVADQDYVVLAPTGGDVARLYKLMYGDRKLDPTTRADFDEDGDTGEPREYYIEPPNTLRLYPVPDAIYAMVAHVAVTPDRDATTLDDTLYNNWRDEIAAGAKARLMLMKNQPWYDPDGAAIAQNAFQAAIDRAAHKRATGNVGTPLRTRLHTF